MEDNEYMFLTPALKTKQELNNRGINNLSSYIDFIQTDKTFLDANDLERQEIIKIATNKWIEFENTINKDQAYAKQFTNDPIARQDYESIQRLKDGNYERHPERFTNVTQKRLIDQGSIAGSQAFEQFIEYFPFADVRAGYRALFDDDGATNRLHNGSYDETRIDRQYQRFFSVKNKESGEEELADYRTIKIGNLFGNKFRDRFVDNANKLGILDQLQFNKRTGEITVPNDRKVFLDFCRAYSKAYTASASTGWLTDTADTIGNVTDANGNKFIEHRGVHSSILNVDERYNDAMSLMDEYDELFEYNVNTPLYVMSNDIDTQNIINRYFKGQIKSTDFTKQKEEFEELLKFHALNAGANQYTIKAPENVQGLTKLQDFVGKEIKEGKDDLFVKLDEASASTRLTKAQQAIKEGKAEIRMAFDHNGSGIYVKYYTGKDDEKDKAYDMIYIEGIGSNDAGFKAFNNSSSTKARQQLAIWNAVGDPNISHKFAFGNSEFSLKATGDNNYILSGNDLPDKVFDDSNKDQLMQLLQYSHVFNTEAVKHIQNQMQIQHQLKSKYDIYTLQSRINNLKNAPNANSYQEELNMLQRQFNDKFKQFQKEYTTTLQNYYKQELGSYNGMYDANGNYRKGFKNLMDDILFNIYGDKVMTSDGVRNLHSNMYNYYFNL